MEAIEGLDVEQALRRMGGSTVVYKKLLLRYCEQNQHLVDEMNQMFKAGDHEELLRSLHTFKSVSGNLGVVELYRLTGDLELQLKEGNWERYHRRFGQFSTILAKTFSSIKQHLD